MRVKYINKKEELGMKFGGTYNVFSVIIGIKQTWNKFYIKPNGPKYIYPFDTKDFEIIDNKIPKIWSIGINNLGQLNIAPKEIYEINNFWEDYYNDKKENKCIVEDYYKLGKLEIFN